jgi:hypothetical protein
MTGGSICAKNVEGHTQAFYAVMFHLKMQKYAASPHYY